MRATLTEDQLAIRGGIERLVAEKAGAAGAGELWSALSELGWLGLALPEDRGGSGRSVLEMGLLTAATGYHGLVTPFLSSMVLGAGVLARTTAGGESPELLAAAAQGRTLLALAHQEDGDFNPATLKTMASPHGRGWRLRGTKQAALGAPRAAYLAISACIRRGDADIPALFLVPAATTGLQIRSIPTLRGEEAGEVRLDADLGAAALVLEGEAARSALDAAMDEAVIVLCWEALGAMCALVDQTVAYVKTRRQFGKAIAEFQVVQHRLAEMAVLCEESRAVAELAALKTQSSAPARARAASFAKVKMCRAARFISHEAVQLHGAIGITEDLPVARRFRHLLAFQAMLGTADAHLQRYARDVVATRRHVASAVFE